MDIRDDLLDLVAQRAPHLAQDPASKDVIASMVDILVTSNPDLTLQAYFAVLCHSISELTKAVDVHELCQK